MIFCLGEGRYKTEGKGYQKNNRIFNKEVSEEEFNKAKNLQPTLLLPISMWIEAETGGYLKTLSYKDAWKEVWKTASKEFKDWVKNLPNFDAELFEKITGVKFESEIKEMTIKEISEKLGYEVKIIK